MWKTSLSMVTLRISRTRVARLGDSVIMTVLLVDLITIRWRASPADRCLLRAARASETSLVASSPNEPSPLRSKTWQPVDELA